MKELTPHDRDRNWFIIFSVALVFGIVWAIVGENGLKLVYIAIAFGLFLHSGITMELNARHADGDGH